MKTLIVDDESIARRILREELELLPEIVVVGEAENGVDALRRIEELRPDLVFLDLQMPVMGGFDVIRNLSGTRLPVVIVVTAYQQHAIQAFEAGAVDYLLKPVSAPRLHKAVDRATSLVGKPLEIAQELAKIAASGGAAPAPGPQKIVGRIGREYLLMDTDEVLAVQAEGELVWIITAKRRILATQTLRALETRLQPSTFQRVHRNAIVNVNHVRKMSAMTSNRWLLTLSNQQEFVVSKRQAHNVRRILQW